MKSLLSTNPSRFLELKKAFGLLEKKARQRYLLMTFANSSLSFLDTLSVALVGLIGLSTISILQGGPEDTRALKIYEWLQISELSQQLRIAILGFVVVIFVIVKAFFGYYISKRILLFLNSQAIVLSKNLLLRLMNNDIAKIRSNTLQRTILAATSGVETITVGIAGSTSLLISEVFLSIVLFGTLLVFNPTIALFSLIFFSSVGRLLYVKVKKASLESGKKANESLIKVNEKIAELIFCYREILLRGKVGSNIENIIGFKQEGVRHQNKLAIMSFVSKYVFEVALIIGALSFSAFQFIVYDAKTALGNLSIFLMVSFRMAPAILRIQQNLVSLRGHLGAARATYDLIDSIDSERHIWTASGESLGVFSIDHEGFIGKVALQDVSFSYPNTIEPALKSINIELKENSFNAIVGPSGSGKSTLFDLLIGALTPNTGNILISDQNNKDCINKWPGAVAFVPQNVVIINGSLRKNITLGFDDGIFTDEEVIACLKEAQLSELITSTDSIHREVGDQGFRLSGGQKQRLGIARALITQPKLLLLDEATSSLDSVTEFSITQTIRHLRKSKTIVVIAHRLSTVQNADTLFYLEKGRILSTGSFNKVRSEVPNFETQSKLLGI